jgi:hypothetical protein
MISVSHAIGAGVLTAVLYGSASYSVKGRWNNKLPINPLKIVADFTGRASLANTQVFFFSLIVIWLSLYWVLRTGTLVPFDDTVLGLLGIAVGGAAGGKIADAARNRVSAENWAWAKKKKWIQRDFTKASLDRTPRVGDLFTSDQGFEVARFQAVAFSLVVGLSLLVRGTTAPVGDIQAVDVNATYLTLIGISQGVYIGGKVVWPSLIAEIDAKLDKVRGLELAFVTAVAKSSAWAAAPAAERNLALSRQAAPAEYNAYVGSASEAAEMVRESTGGNVITREMTEPDLPQA